MSTPLAFFDFDGTLTRGDTLVPFLRHVGGSARLAIDLLAASPWLLAHAVGAITNTAAKERLLWQALSGIRLDDLRSDGERFARDRIPGMLRPDTFARLRAHQEQGHRCVLVSASLDLYLLPWSRAQGFDACLSSSLSTDESGNVTGTLQGANCHGEEKVRRIKLLLEESPPPSRTYAYGDSRGDLPMLAIVDEGYLAGPGRLRPWPRH